MFDPYKKWLGIPPKDQPPNHYRLLSLELYESDLDVIEGAADRVMGFLRQYQSGENAADAAKLLNEVATARICLLKPPSKKEYDEKLRKQLTVQVPETSVDEEAEALASLPIDDQLPDLPIAPRKKRTPASRKAKSNSSSNPPWIPIGIGAGIVVLLAAMMLRPGAPRNLAPDSNGGTSTPAVNPAQSNVESKPSSSETTAGKGDAAMATKVGRPDPVTAKSTEAPPAVAASIPTTPASSEQPKPTTSDAKPQKLWGAAPPLDPSIIHSDYLVEDKKWGPHPYCLLPALVETPEGLVAAFVSGTEPKARDVGVWITRSSKDYKWTTPVMVANVDIDKDTDPNLFPCGNPVLFQYARGELALCYRVGPDPNSWRSVVKFSANHGESWGKPQILPEGISGPTKTKPYVLPDKSLLCGSSTQRDDLWRVHFERFDGKQWTKSPPINDGDKLKLIEPALLSHGNDRWQAIGRSHRNHGKIWEAWSNDAGKSWGEPSFLDMPNPSSSIDAIRLKDGRFALIYNHSATKRTPLCVAFSNDGRSWQAGLVMESDEAESSHPTIIQTNDGLVHVAYCRFNKHIRHCVFDPKKVRLKPIVDGVWPSASVEASFREEETNQR